MLSNFNTRRFAVRAAILGGLAWALASCGGTFTSSQPFQTSTKDADKRQVWVSASVGITGEGTSSATLTSEAQTLLENARTEFINRTAAGMNNAINSGNLEAEARSTLESILGQQTQNRRDLKFEIYSLSAVDMLKQCQENLDQWMTQNGKAYGLKAGDKSCASDSNNDGRATVNIPNHALSAEYGMNIYHELKVDMKQAGVPYFDKAHENTLNAQISQIQAQRAAAQQPVFYPGNVAPVAPAPAQ